MAALLTSSLAVKLKNHAKQAAQAAYRTKVLFDTNQLLQQAKGKNEIVSATANQLIKLLGKDIVFYLSENETLSEPHIFTVSGDKTDEEITGINEKAVAEWVLKNNKHAGATTETLSSAKCLCLAVRVNSRVYGVVGIYIGNEPLEEAAGYYHIGEGKLRMLIDEHPNEDFYVMNGNRALIKREKFERYLDQATAV